MEEYINPWLHKVIKTEHPVAAARKGRSWNTENMFKKVNYYLKHSKKEQIEWLPLENNIINEKGINNLQYS